MMRRGTVINFSGIKFTEFLSENKSLIALIFSFILGVLTAVCFFDNNSFLTTLSDSFFSFYTAEHIGLSFGKVFLNSLLLGLTLLCLYFVFGTTMLGLVFLPILNFVFGIYFGCLSSFICSSYSLMGVAFNAIVLIPGMLILTVALVFAARESLQFSFSVSRMTFAGSQYNDLPARFKGFCIKYIILVIAVTFSALSDAFFTSALSSIFDF